VSRGGEKKRKNALAFQIGSPNLAFVQSEFVYRGRKVSATEIEFIRQLIAAHPALSRRRLSAKLCEAWNWVQPNGRPRDMVARSLMLELHRAGHIRLPAQRFCPPNNAARHRAPTPQPVCARAPWECSLVELGSLEIRQVRRTPAEKLFGGLMEAHHYLAYTQPVGEHLKYLAYAQGQPIAALAWSSAPRHLGPRDRFIGWSALQRRAQIHLLAYNSRFLILPWVRVPHLASHLLGRVARQIAADWQALYEHPVCLLETFIDPERFAGTSYRAANWIYLGLTTGRGKDDQTNRSNRSLKELWVYPLLADFRRQLYGEDCG
jgi:hypothetical protein